MANFTCASHLAVESLSTGVVAVNEAENCGAGSGAGMLLSSAQLEEFKTNLKQLEAQNAVVSELKAKTSTFHE